MPRIMRCKDLREAVECLKDEGNDCADVAAYLYAAGIPRNQALNLLAGAGFTEDQALAATAAPYASVKERVVDRLRTLRTMTESAEGTSCESAAD